MTEDVKKAWKVDGISLSWITVKNLDAAIKYYTEMVGLKLTEHHPEHKWAELQGPNGAYLGLAEEDPEMDIKAGTNAIVCVNVDNVEAARNAFIEKGATLLGDIIEVPGHVKMQTFQDVDGNVMQLTEILGN